ncbi:insecticidal toxin SepC/TccC [Xenorhabdus stockiae]|uniref:Insecticidal toxin SepC/TccC n=1 Tax=Xenorhabdus stockiae TaxID=351614 RepID=A0A2D0KBG7_9GAMM|nr:hypothetical protein [Xenorhabdus stockiae]PHM60814.1 insecticidal toxin SepC/TccC [Xenorhabdus stockiae]
MDISLHKNTPTVTVLDCRGLTIRELAYHRHPDTPESTATGGSIDQVAEMGTFVTLHAGNNDIKFSITVPMDNIVGVDTPIRRP